MAPSGKQQQQCTEQPPGRVTLKITCRRIRNRFSGKCSAEEMDNSPRNPKQNPFPDRSVLSRTLSVSTDGTATRILLRHFILVATFIVFSSNNSLYSLISKSQKDISYVILHITAPSVISSLAERFNLRFTSQKKDKLRSLCLHIVLRL